MNLKGPCHEIFDPRCFSFFIKTSVLHGPLNTGGKSLLKHKFIFAKLFETFHMHAVSLTPHAKYDTAWTNDSCRSGCLKGEYLYTKKTYTVYR
jgi:hypothetical protein